MSDFLTNLGDSLLQDDKENVRKLLKSPDKNNVKLNDPQLVKALLSYEDNQIITSASETIAEWAKADHNRIILAEKEIIDLLLNLLESDEHIVLNVVRALGNICYENELATKILNKEGLEKILTLFYELKQDNSMLLLAKISGLLLNIFISNEDLQFIDKNELLGHISLILSDHTKISSDEFCLYSYLLQIVYTLLVEYDHQVIYSEKLHRKVIDILKSQTCLSWN
ncbi:hypothetical protein HHI36_020293 [Cryptolaemus montrouzieri]|uniref:Uncharacterized protein n=1 Tax=Cryptolaemus montrouzieri TaxID=559131 RepID=A0ABD2NAH1_9CUCU